ncbi:MAG: TIGR04255 family protein [Alphaproteobacteria bacterium]|nr:TIGR04255 family protein [Alphaproteobacteria bacterium]
MTASDSNLPNFKDPPVVEVAIGVQFDTLEHFYIPHVGLLWDRLDRKKFTACEELSPIITAPEKDAFLVFDKPMMPRIWFVSDDKDMIVQFQRDRFNYNWRKHTADSILEKSYPRYGCVKKEFYSSIQKLEACLEELHIDPINPQRLEVSYINIIPLDTIGGVDKIGKVLKDIDWRPGHTVLPDPHKISAHWQFRVKEINSLLDLRVNTMPLSLTGQEVLRVELTVRGQAPYKDIKACEPWLDEARRAIVKGFVDITTPEAHKVWGLL